MVGNASMLRIAIAFLLAPLWVPLACAVMPILWGERPSLNPIIYAGFLIGYGATFCIGRPLLSDLSQRGFNKPYHALLSGILSSIAVYLIISTILVFIFTSSISRALRDHFTLDGMILIFYAGTVGALVGITVWLIARPDRYPLAPIRPWGS